MLQPLLLRDGEPVEDTLEQADGLAVALTVSLLVPHTVAVLLCEAECVELALGDSEPDTLPHSEAVADAQLLEDAEGLVEGLMEPLTVPECVLDRVAEAQAEADTETLELGEMVRETELQPLLVREGELVADTLAQDDWLTDTLGDPLLVWVPDTEPQADADTDTLLLEEMVRETELQPLLVREGELVADTLAQEEGLADVLGEPLLV